MRGFFYLPHPDNYRDPKGALNNKIRFLTSFGMTLTCDLNGTVGGRAGRARPTTYPNEIKPCHSECNEEST
jgi:hypothetical protein